MDEAQEATHFLAEVSAMADECHRAAATSSVAIIRGDKQAAVNRGERCSRSRESNVFIFEGELGFKAGIELTPLSRMASLIQDFYDFFLCDSLDSIA